ncbi:TniQ family protein [Kitasatospora aureofaciens]|uniref:TniQ family protein n=1 Tax=Kitasatospora aureofaciens TaxID=1894 RepID=UPI0037CBFA54
MLLDGLSPWGPSQRLPLLVRYFAQESTGSFVNRLAHRNGLELGDFLERVGHGTRAVDPRYTEMYVNRPGLEHLAVLVDRPAEELQRVLPGLAEHRLLPEGGDWAAWRWRWEPVAGDGFVVRGCDLCARWRGVDEAVWRMSPDRWQVCVRHGRWTDDSRSDIPGVVRLDAVPEVVRAHRERLGLQRRFPLAGAALFADAFQVAVHWWSCMPHTQRWIGRARRVGLEPHEVRGAAVSLYPEAVSLARAMVRFERYAERGARERSAWAGGVQRMMDGWGLDVERGTVPLLEWMQRHVRPAPRPAAGSRRAFAPAVGHVRLAAASGSVEQLSCLPWQLGADPSQW